VPEPRSLKGAAAFALRASAPTLVIAMRPEFETFLARLYTDAQLRARVLADPRGEAERAQLTVEECAALERIDRVGLEMSARSFAHKRALKAKVSRARSWWRYVEAAFKRP
jgi:hypothetical protein